MLVDMLTKISTIWRQFRSVFDGRHYVSWRVFPFGGLWSRLRCLYNQYVIRRAQNDGIVCADCTLDPQQIEAVVACEDAQLVLASAGSGKTLSLLAKIEYLAHELHIPPRQILVISFTQKTVVELKERCSVKDADIRTFHSLGNYILQSQKSDLGSKTLIDEDEVRRIFSNALNDLRRNDKIARAINDYLLLYAPSPRSPGGAETFRDWIDYNRRYLHQRDAEQLRHISEQLVSNWFRIYDAKYELRRPYPYSTKYCPTFSLPDSTYLEILDVSKTGKSFRGREYLRDIKWREKLHHKYGTRFIKLYSYQ